MVNFHGRFVWYELMTTDTETAEGLLRQCLGLGARGMPRCPVRPIACLPLEIPLSLD